MVNLSELTSKLAEFSRTRHNYNKRMSEIETKISDSIVGLHAVEKEIDKKIVENIRIQNLTESTKQLTQKIASNSKSTHPWLATAFADANHLYDAALSKLLLTKKPSAPRAAEALAVIAREKRKILRELKECQYKIKYYETLFPELEEYIDEDDDESDTIIDEEESDKDEILIYISKDEYENLDTVKRNQLALDRYKKQRHSKSHVGKMYERYIGYLYEQLGFHVEYFGIKEKLNDLGRDLICTKSDGEVHVVQCKNWSKNKVIHENVICQLYGTATKFKIERRKKSGDLFYNNVKPVFVTTTLLSQTAIDFADELGVKRSITPMSLDYPIIKCNVGSYGQKIYHLPFDQQYDRTQICKDGEFYAKTVAEAEANGFRRAKRWVAEATSD